MEIVYRDLHDSGITLDDCSRCMTCQTIVANIDKEQHEEWHTALASTIASYTHNCGLNA